jgi:hypothetical protein
LNERYTVFLALTAAELGGSAVLLLSAPERVKTAGFTSLLEMLLPHAAAVAAFWGVVAAATWVLAPGIWRIRQGLASKLRLLSWVFAIGLLLDNVVTFLLSMDPAVMEVGDVAVVRSDESLGLALLLRSLGMLLCFWGTVWVHVLVERRRPVQVTPPPKFGKG